MARPQLPAVDAAIFEGEIIPVEQAVIGCILLEPKSAIPPLMPAEFYLDHHTAAWEAILALDAAGTRADAVSLEYALRTSGKMPATLPPSLIALWIERAAISAHLTHYAGVVRAAARERMKRALGHELASRGLSEEDILRRLDELPGPLAAPLFDPAINWRNLVEIAQRGRIMTGFAKLDEMTGGLGDGDFIVVGGRTSHGKTAYLTALMLRLAQVGVEVEYITLEESTNAIVRRLVANLTSISMLRLKDLSVSEDEFRRAEQAVRTLQALPMIVTGVEHLRLIDEATVVSSVSRSKSPVVIVDHLQQITTKDHRRVDGLERVMKRLQSVALRDGKILILAAQLNREVEARQGAPRLSDLRDCGAIEQAARQVWLLYWKCKHDRDADPLDYELHLAKQSDGGTSVIPLRFEAWCGRFADGEIG